MKTIRLIGAAALVVGSCTFSYAQDVMESAKPIQQKVEITKELEERVRNGASRVATKKTQAMTLEQGKAYAAKRFAEKKAKGLLREEGNSPEQTTK